MKQFFIFIFALVYLFVVGFSGYYSNSSMGSDTFGEMIFGLVMLILLVNWYLNGIDQADDEEKDLAFYLLTYSKLFGIVLLYYFFVGIYFLV